MTDAWLVVREEKHLDPKFWVCLDRGDALRIAGDVTEYWKEQYRSGEADETCYGEQVYHFHAEDRFSVRVEPVMVRDPGEYHQTEGEP